MKLNLGCGCDRKSGYLNCDLWAPGCERIDLITLAGLEADSVDEIFSSHSLEHIDRVLVPVALKRWLAVLKPGGRVVVDVPNMVGIAKNICEAEASGNLDQLNWWLTTVYGLETSPGEYHKNGFTPLLAQTLFDAAGFADIKIEHTNSHAQPSITITARKP